MDFTEKIIMPYIIFWFLSLYHRPDWLAELASRPINLKTQLQHLLRESDNFQFHDGLRDNFKAALG